MSGPEAMRRVEVSVAARQDLQEISRYTARKWGRGQAKKYLTELTSFCSVLARQPHLGRKCDEVRPGLHRAEIARHVIFYRVFPERITISRILHGRIPPELESSL